MKDARGLLGMGPPDLMARTGLLGSLTGGIGGGASVTGVGGRWIVTFGGASSLPRIKRSASFSRHQRTSLSVSGALYPQILVQIIGRQKKQRTGRWA